MTLKQRLILFAATGGMVGYAPVAPGTWGTLVGIPLIFLCSVLPLSWQTFAVVLFIMGAVWIAQEAEPIFEKKDPGAIVIDEIAGYLVALVGLPVTFTSLLAGFLLFRFFDIVKPFPIRYFERQFSGGAGVVLDDIFAGLYTGLVLRLFF
ncbi:phosphatidylglycerophosphatase [Desulfocicer vacuolatum DSM 3385]|uniref:Phosphatidylglycerophosphatase n=1 Tax=Desulfocicer vacuolatum DSM 3385 TaxID=1121400 RepID=A0A1W2D2H0_9BACT|nr:phosphatidylglycerophosphatase A [Desulfocicer vacuolatum]SMC91643.1 phosphatidylglycerophosphatase [Desulfocicer vacuolatum DSM 3385]